jgi:heptosyltransferase-1
MSGMKIPCSILIVKTSALGDVIHTFPVLEYLKRKFPDVRIDWVVEKGCAELVTSHPLVNKTILVETKKWRKELFQLKTWKEIKQLKRQLKAIEYDLLFDFQGNCKSSAFVAWARAKEKVGYGLSCVPEKPNLLVTSKKIDVPASLNIRHRYLYLVQKFFEDSFDFTPNGVVLETPAEKKEALFRLIEDQKRPLLMVCFGSKWQNKQLKEETLIEFLHLISSHYSPFFVFIWSNEEEKLIASRLEGIFSGKGLLIGGLTLPLLQVLMARMDGVISMDSATLHLCGTTKTPSFSLFGPSSLEIYIPLGEQHSGFQGICPYGQTFHKRCPELRSCKTGACLREVPPEQLFERFKLWWQSLQKT